MQGSTAKDSDVDPGQTCVATLTSRRKSDKTNLPENIEKQNLDLILRETHRCTWGRGPEEPCYICYA